MDSFDDLLAPSRNILEENPFSDPFTKRSGSPDPWATPFGHESSNDLYSSPFASSSAESEPAHTPVAETFGSSSETTKVDDTETGTSSSTPSPDIPSDPLDSATQTVKDDDDDEPLSKRLSLTSSARSPGFKESVESSSKFSEIATIRPNVSEEFESTIPATTVIPHSEEPHPQASTPLATDLDVVARSPTSAIRAKTPPQVEQAVEDLTIPSHSRTDTTASSAWGPLEQSPIQPIDRSLSNLTLGGESAGGWRGEQESWSNDQPVVSRVPSDEDSDDDKPIAQTVKALSQSVSMSPKQNASTRTELRPEFVISVDDPQKVGDPIRSFTMYTVHTRTTSPLFQKSAFSVLRRYSDFLWLYETLSLNNPGVVVPPVPEKNPFGRFDDQFVKQRRFALEKCIQKIANHPILGKDTDLKLFLESDTFSLDIKHRKAEIANEKGGLMASIGQTIAGPRFHETDEWFDRQKAYLDSLESQLRGLVRAIDMVTKQRAEMSTATNEFAQTVGDLSSSDIGKQLSLSLAGLADVERKAHDLQVTQSEQDMITLMGTVDEYARLINSVRLAFSSRIRMYHARRNAESDLLRAKQTHEKNRAQGRIPTDRLGYSLSQIAEAERRAADAKHEYEQVSKLVKTEVARFERERIEDFKDSLHAFLEGMISRQKELIAAWESYQQMLLKRVGGGKGAPAVQDSPVSSSQ